MRNKRERKYYILIVLFLALYLVLSQFAESPPPISTRITTVTAIIAAVTFWMQLRRTENLNEANFLMNLNNQFISNKEMTTVEHKLECYYNEVALGGDVAEVKLDLNLDLMHEDRQKMINYLVHMEALSAIIEKNVMRLGVVDDLFAFRFFVAVNNPVVQETELLPYANYYRGCFRLSEKWTKVWRESNREIPLEQFTLYERVNRQ